MWTPWRQEQAPELTPEERRAKQAEAFESFRARSAEEEAQREAAAVPQRRPGQGDDDYTRELEFWENIRAANEERRAENERRGIRSAPSYSVTSRSASYEQQEQARELRWYIGAFAVVVAGSLVTSVVSDANYGSDRAVRFVEDQGYREAEVTGKHILFPGWNGCDGGDRVAYDVEALPRIANGSEINVEPRDLVVCVGFFKGATLREK